MPAVKFVFPLGCSESFEFADMPCIPRAGEFVQGEHPDSGRYRVAEVIYDIGPGHDGLGACNSAMVILEVTDKTNLEPNR